MTDVVSSGKATDWRVSEHSQTKFTIVDYHEYPNKKVVTEAITGLEWMLFSLAKMVKYFRLKINLI